MARDPQEDGQFSKRPNENDGLEGDGPLAEEAANVDLAERKMAEHSRLRAIEEEDEERVEGVERGEEEVGREVEGDEELINWRQSTYRAQESARERGPTVSRSRIGLMSRKMKQKPATSPAQRRASPRRSLRKVVAGVRLPNAFARRNRGNASRTSAVWM